MHIISSGVERTLPSLTVACLLGLLLACSACREQQTIQTYEDTTAESVGHREADLRQALDLLDHFEDYDPSQARQKISYHLQQWLKAQPVPEDWQPDPLAARIPQPYSPMVATSQLQRSQLDQYDIQVLQEATWLSGIADSVLRLNDPPPDIAEWVDATMESTDPQYGSLSQATALFDWTVRNLKQDAPVSHQSVSRFRSDLLLHAWEVLLMGRGTAAEKARVFLLLCRQQGLPVVILSTAQTFREQATAPFLCGLLLDERIYLYDMALGLPVLLPSGAIASLDQWREATSKLAPGREDLEYSVTPDDADTLTALVDASPAYLAQRMHVLENALDSDRKRILTVQPSALESRLRDRAAILDVAI